VVLRWNDSKSKPPKEAIRAAASIAAYYSGAKNAKMVPVAYTLKKHVRKPKGAAVGAVVMEREEVVLVEPKLPGGGE
jgi:predicted ribosome quality control (RQC) complex YloA/Tae2 family protein